MANWPTINRRRGELIDKQIEGTLTANEQAELATLQDYADAHVAPFNEPKLDALKALEDVVQFDITDGKNRYEPCPRCGAEFNMGLVTQKNLLAVQCMECGLRGPEIDNTRPSPENDKAAFDGWNTSEICEKCGKITDFAADGNAGGFLCRVCFG